MIAHWRGVSDIIPMKLTPKFLGELERIVGAENLLTDPADLEKYSRDETPELSALPDAAVVCETAEQVERVVKLCYEHDVPITPRGAGTGVAGGAVPVAGGIVLSVERMNKILEIDRENLVAVAQPGTITGNLQRAVEAEGLYYPPDPASVDSCSIGGNVATGAGGMRAFKYGTTKKFVQGVEVVLPGGFRARFGGKMIKDVAGYDLLGILVGSEGTLGIFTEVMVRLLPKPAYSVDLLAGFETPAQCAAAALSIVPETGIMPAAMEFIEGEIIQMISEVLEREIPLADSGAQLIVSVDGFDEAEVERQYFAVGEHLLARGARDVLVARTRTHSELLWRSRRSIREAIRHRSPDIVAEDLAVPPSRVVDLLDGVKRIGEKFGAQIVGFGHIGDGNLHIDLMRNRMEQEQWERAKRQIVPELFKLAVSLDGTITGEHGIGYVKRAFLPLMRPAPVIETMRQIKKSWDPKNLMNPEKIFEG